MYIAPNIGLGQDDGSSDLGAGSWVAILAAAFVALLVIGVGGGRWAKL
jgi:hypothetical protein